MFRTVNSKKENDANSGWELSGIVVHDEFSYCWTGAEVQDSWLWILFRSEIKMVC